MSRGPKSVDCASLGGPYAEAFSRFNYTCIQIEGDEKETIILLERIIKAKGGQRSYYVVQRKVEGKYRYEIAKANEVKVALEDWQAERGRWIVDETKKEGKFQSKQVGEFKEYWFAAYMTPPARIVGTTPRSPTTLSVAVSDKGPQVLIFGDLASWIGQEKAESLVEKSCQSQGVPTPWAVRSQTVIVNDPRCHNPIQTRRQKREVTTLPEEEITGSPKLQSINPSSLGSIQRIIDDAIKRTLEPVITGQHEFQKQLLEMMIRIEKLEDRLPGAPTVDLSNQT
ncbi:hypothetical protein N7533_008307 [Penicillium manginii]|jgi:hypothetical protein|uniref:uncharacterized protein n=1 Tax=Penicillium manginii TaxID=203109 RepID=UPI002546EEA5|nr:uncharacterized protein N7533_008307 [Penicillium manginii]KAJ5751279.1 hypothetical protein N7533_008307 [Penicillium manginii]